MPTKKATTNSPPAQPKNSSTSRKTTKSAPPVEAEIEAVKIKRLTLDIPEPLHRAIKMRSVEEGVAMVDMLRLLLQEHYAKK
jgi:hypothetical protein